MWPLLTVQWGWQTRNQNVKYSVEYTNGVAPHLANPIESIAKWKAP